MATTILRDQTINTVGELPKVGAPLPPFTLTLGDLSDYDSAQLAGGSVVLNVFPSVDTRVCALSVRRFNDEAAKLEGSTVVCISHDLPFALSRFCGAEGIDSVVTGSAFRSSFGADYGLTMTDGPMAGLLARAVIVAGPDGVVKHVELTKTIGQEPEYEAALAALN